jgi:replicative superfamily II helicase
MQNESKRRCHAVEPICHQAQTAKAMDAQQAPKSQASVSSSQAHVQFSLSDLQTKTLERLASSDNKARVLVVQPCCTGKSCYYTHFAKQPNTIVILAQPFVSLKQQTASDAVTARIQTRIEQGVPLKNQVLAQGLLILCSYERLNSQVMLAKQAIAEGVRVIICIDEVHVLLDSVAVAVSGYRNFMAVWTLIASLESYDFKMFATSATVRPRVELLLCKELGFLSWSEVIRSSPARPEVQLKKSVLENRAQALLALVHEDPQMVNSIA